MVREVRMDGAKHLEQIGRGTRYGGAPDPV
jgi:hypothetical protein